MVKKTKIAKIAEVINPKFSDSDLKMMDILSNNPDQKYSYAEISEECGVSVSSVSRRIRYLATEGLVIRIPVGKNRVKVQWVGGVPRFETELISATSRRASAALLTENYDSMVLDRFSLFSLIFDDNYWEVITNLHVGLNDVEILQRLSHVLSLDGIRRVMVIASAHNIVKLTTIREPSGTDISSIFEPLYRISEVNRRYVNYLIMMRGLAGAMSWEFEGIDTQNQRHIYQSILSVAYSGYMGVKNETMEQVDPRVSTILTKLMDNYSSMNDLEKMMGDDGAWRINVIEYPKIFSVAPTDELGITDTYSELLKKKGCKEILK